jgi:hypothetical protein|tara:strand:+ start:5713 stop:5901 length:189 start_codon:yes stop_codon:yes gene_type:complete
LANRFRDARSDMAASDHRINFVVVWFLYAPDAINEYTNVCTSWFLGNRYTITTLDSPVVVTW